MPKFIVEREIPGAGQFSPETLRTVSQKSREVLQGMGPQIQWVTSYVTENKLYCIYIAPSAAEILEHARRGGFPANQVLEVKSCIDPTTAE